MKNWIIKECMVSNLLQLDIRLCKNFFFPIKIVGRVYVPPKVLRKRKDVVESTDSKVVQPNEDVTGVELHKDSKFYQSWQNFKVYNLK